MAFLKHVDFCFISIFFEHMKGHLIFQYDTKVKQLSSILGLENLP